MSTERVMLLIDADNVSLDVMEQALRMLMNQHGAVHVRRAYCTAESAVKHQAFFKRMSIKPMVNLAAGKNSTDIALAVDAIDLVLAERPDVVVIASSDSDFAPLVARLREKGCVVRGIGQQGKTGDETQDAYDDYTVLEHRAGSASAGSAAPVRGGRRTTARTAGTAGTPTAAVATAGAGRTAAAKAGAGRKPAARARAAPVPLPLPVPVPVPEPSPLPPPEASPIAAPVTTTPAKTDAEPSSASPAPAAKRTTRKTATKKTAASAPAKTAAAKKAPARKTAARKSPAAAAAGSAVAAVAAEVAPEPVVKTSAPVAPPAPAPFPDSPVSPVSQTAAPRQGATVQAVLKCLPELAAGQSLALNVAVQRLREGQLLGRNTSSLKLFSALGPAFELLPADKPSQVRLRR